MLRQQGNAASTLLTGFPKSRPALSPRHREIYVREYQRNRERHGFFEKLSRQAEGWMHRRVAARCGVGATLELGAGTLNHLTYEAPGPAYDIVEPFEDLFASSPLLSGVRQIYSNQADIGSTVAYSRIISIAVLEHMTDLPKELATAGLLLAPEGLFQAAIPSEGGTLWWLGWRCTTGLGYWLRNRLDYGVVMRHEHVNSAAEIIALVRYLFADVRISRFPLPLHHLSLYAYIEARLPNRRLCESVLASGRPVR
jgi:hypothetical protein